MRSSELADLIETAREVFRAELAPNVPEDKRYAAAMVANAMAIAARGLRVEADGDLAGHMTGLYGPEAAGTPLVELERRLVADIRAGRFGGTEEGRLRAFLTARTIARLKVSDPGALAASGLG